MAVAPQASSISPGQTVQLVATPRDAQGAALANRTVTWISTNTAVVSISPAGLATAVAVGGPVTIVASSEGQDGTALVTVVPPPVASVAVSPATPALTPNAVVQLSATVRDAQGNVLTGRAVTWATSNPGVATVSGSGLVTAVAMGGPVTITATSEGQGGTAAVSVVAPVVTTITLSPAVTSVAAGGSTPLTPTVRDQNDIILTGVALTWSTSNTAIATVSASGMVSGVSSGGPVTVTAAAGGKTGSASVTVTSSPCDTSTPIALGQTLAGTLASADCVLNDGSYMDLFRFPVPADGRLQFDVMSTAFDAYLILFIENPDGSRVAVGGDNNSGGGTNARMTRNALAGETYFIGANSLLEGITGAYQVSVQSVEMVAGRPLALPSAAPDPVALAKLAAAAGVIR